MNYFIQHQWLYSELGSGSHIQNGAEALAWQDAFIRYIPTLNLESSTTSFPTGMLHLYHLEHPTVLLGPKDTQLPQLSKGIDYLKTNNYATHLRAHGGLAVVSDPGVLNISFITDNLHYPLTIDQAYEQMVQWVKATLEPVNLTVESYEVPQSYCPGTYDIVVNEKKIGGIAQRRFKSGVATAAYISVNGNQNQRANLIKEFYQISQADTSYPAVKSNVMATISDFLSQPLSIETFKETLIHTLESYSSIKSLDTIKPELLITYQRMLEKSLERNLSL